MKLLPEEKLIWSPIVVNSRMNRERNASGVNSYEKEFKLAPEKYLHAKLKEKEHITWIDLCCGQGNALIQTAEYFINLGLDQEVELEGIDLVDTFPSLNGELACLDLVSKSLTSWTPAKKYDLITCVHGLHYLGDKLKILSNAIAALQPDGLFIANLDLDNVKIDEQSSDTYLKKKFKLNGLEYNSRVKVMKKIGGSQVDFHLKYLGADDKHGPNYTGQDSVTSYYST